MTYGLNRCNPLNIWAYISITNFPGMFNVTSYVPMLQAEYRSSVEWDICVGLVHLSCLTKINNPTCFWLCLFCLVSYKTRQHIKITSGSKLRCQNCYGKLWLRKFQKCWFIIWTQLGISQRKMQLFYITKGVRALNGLTPPHLTDSIVRGN